MPASGPVPDKPDVTVHAERLHARLVGLPLRRVRLERSFLLRTVEPPPSGTSTTRSSVR
jgi:hypothetical protein